MIDIRKKVDSLLICSAAGNFMLCILGLILTPMIYRATELHMNMQKPAMIIMTAVMAAVTVAFMAVMGYISVGSRGEGSVKGFARHLKGCAQFAVIFAAAVFLYALLCGAVASLMYLILGKALQYTTIKLAINITTYITTIAVIPVVIMELLTFSLCRLPIKQALTAGFAAAKENYLKLLLITVVFFIFGTAASALIQLIDSAFLSTVLTLAAYTVIGGAGTYIIYRMGAREL